ncbi:MAG: TldD/PmbA family protein, partial [Desulfomonilaceae bacterium]
YGIINIQSVGEDYKMSEFVNIVEEILNKRKLDQWEIFLQKSSNFRVQTKQSKTDFVQKAELSGLAVRLIKNHRMGFSFSSNLDYASLKQTVDMAESVADVTSEDPDYSFTVPVESTQAINEFFCPEIEETNELEKISIARTIEETAFARDKCVSAVRSSGYSDHILEAEIRNSLGLRVQAKAGLARIWIELMAESASGQEMSYWSGQARSPKTLDPVKLGQVGADRAISRLGGVAIPSTKCPVLIENTVAASLLGTLSNAFLAESHFKKTVSPRVYIGSKVFAPTINIFDGGLEPEGAKAFPFDGEGAPSQLTEVAHVGELLYLLADNYYSRKLQTKPTANSCRSSFDSAPFNGVTNLFIEHGSSTQSQLISDMGSGIMITEVMGLHTANPISGDFSVGATGFKISGGRIDHPVKGIALAGNLIDLLGSVRNVGNDFQFFGAFGAPSLLVESLSISGE